MNCDSDAESGVHQISDSVCKTVTCSVRKVAKGVAQAALTDGLQRSSGQPPRHVDFRGSSIDFG